MLEVVVNVAKVFLKVISQLIKKHQQVPLISITQAKIIKSHFYRFITPHVEKTMIEKASEWIRILGQA